MVRNSKGFLSFGFFSQLPMNDLILKGSSLWIVFISMLGWFYFHCTYKLTPVSELCLFLDLRSLFFFHLGQSINFNLCRIIITVKILFFYSFETQLSKITKSRTKDALLLSTEDEIVFNVAFSVQRKNHVRFFLFILRSTCDPS